MINNIKIVKEENGNTSFIKNPSNLIDAFLPPVAGIRVNNKSNDEDSIIEIFSITGQKYTFLVSSIESTQIKPAAAVPFSGTAEDLATLLRDSFFFEVDESLSTVWGDITGTLSNQTDLQNALDSLQSTIDNLNASDINNDSAVVGANVAAALNTLNNALAGILPISSNSVTNESAVIGATVTAALNELLNIIGDVINNPSAIYPSQFSEGQTMIADTIIGNQDNYEPTQVGKNFDEIQIVYLRPINNLDISGLIAPIDNSKRVVKYLMNDSGNRNIKLKNNNNNSLPANRFLFEKDLTIKDRQGLIVVYNPIELRWNAVTLK